MKYDQWKRILSAIDNEADLSKDNVIEKIKEKLSQYSDEYTQLSETGFDASLTCLNIEYTSSCIEPGFFGLPPIRNQVEIHHRTLFILAAITGHVKIVEALIERGIDINTVDKDGLTPLHKAAGNAQVEVVNALIKKGANVKAVSKDGITPLHCAALSSNNKEIVEILVKEGADVNASLDESMITPLHMAARGYNANQEVVQALIEKGANIDAVDKDGLTPLHMAASRDFSGKIVKTLIKGKANIDAVDKCGRTPLHFATDCFSSTNIEILIENGADYSLKNKNGEAPIDFNEHVAQLAREKEQKQAEKNAREKGIFAGCATAALSTAIAVTLFATGTVAVELMSVMIAAAIITAAALAVGGITYSILKPSTKMDETKEAQNVNGNVPEGGKAAD
ncbi:ankyrin repeat domain-containing protein [Wolbachia endosymbiont of Dactylopius coccus]